jgi:hypothetical protein
MQWEEFHGSHNVFIIAPRCDEGKMQ